MRQLSDFIIIATNSNQVLLILKDELYDNSDLGPIALQTNSYSKALDFNYVQRFYKYNFFEILTEEQVKSDSLQTMLIDLYLIRNFKDEDIVDILENWDSKVADFKSTEGFFN
jgi:hypothetical protein